MNRKIIIMLLALAGFKSNAQSIAVLKEDMYGIASDATEGRFTGSPGYIRAANYVVKQLKAAGLQPGWVEKGRNTYLQPVPFVWDDYTGSVLIINGVTYPHSADNFIVLERGAVTNDTWVVMAPGDVVKGKPAGIILTPSANQGKDWETTVIRQYRFGYMHYVPDGSNIQTGKLTILISPALTKRLVPGDSVIVQLKYRPVHKTGYNVIAFFPGTDRRFSEQAIIVSAHLDHIGMAGKNIYNGANDDASGCVAALGAAKMLAADRCKRPVIFSFFCGEELNLKGSRWFMDHLPVTGRHIVMGINLEQLGSKHRSFNGVWALGDPQFKPAFTRSGNMFPAEALQFSPMDSSVRQDLSNTDTYSFMNKNIPSLLLGSGGFNEHHTPQDRIDLIDFEHLQKATRLLKNLIVAVGDE